jgi:hypothetical protein
MVQAGAIQVLDALWGQQVTVRDQTGQNPAPADVLNDSFELGVQEGLAATDRNDGRSQRGQPVDATKHYLEGNGFRDFVEFVAVSAGEIATPNRNKVGENRVTG